MPSAPARLGLSAIAAALTFLAALGVAASPASAQTAADYVAPCVPVELVVARGTFEPGPIGVIVGDPLAAAFEARFPPGRVRTTAVASPANGDANSRPIGSLVTTLYLEARAYRCPQTRFVLAGYSQGARVINGALGSLTGQAADTPRINGATGLKVVAILLFGNPQYSPYGPTTGPFYRDKTRDSCYQPGGPRLDPVCGGSGDFNDHVRYVLGDSAAAAIYPAQVLYDSCWPSLIFTDARCKATYWP